jgi:large subunit ribosomal protein L37Ae
VERYPNKNAVKRQVVGIWRCNRCFKTVAGGAWNPVTNMAISAKQTLVRLNKLREEKDN